MKKSLYYRSQFRRENVIRNFFNSLFTALSSYPRLLCEVMIRKDFGERYFRLSSALTVFIILALFPNVLNIFSYFLIPKEFNTFLSQISQTTEPIPDETASFIETEYIAYYLYLFAFLALSIKHYLDKRHTLSTFNFKKFSLYSGRIMPFFFKIEFPDKKTDIKRVECLFEPALFVFAGIFLYLIGQKLGGVLIFSGIVYGLSYAAAYRTGDNFILDKIDQMILNEQLEKTFMGDPDDEQSDYFRYRGRKPHAEDMRKNVLHLFNDEDEAVAVH